MVMVIDHLIADVVLGGRVVMVIDHLIADTVLGGRVVMVIDHLIADAVLGGRVVMVIHHLHTSYFFLKRVPGSTFKQSSIKITYNFFSINRFKILMFVSTCELSNCCKIIL